MAWRSRLIPKRRGPTIRGLSNSKGCRPPIQGSPSQGKRSASPKLGERTALLRPSPRFTAGVAHGLGVPLLALLALPAVAGCKEVALVNEQEPLVAPDAAVPPLEVDAGSLSLRPFRGTFGSITDAVTG